jgi:hypothetical protein
VSILFCVLPHLTVSIECPPFAATLNRSKASSCSQAPVVEEDVMGPMAKLPGCNPFTGQAVGEPSKCPNLVVPAIKGGAGASTLSGSATSASSSAASTSAAHSATSSAGAASSTLASSATSVSVIASSAASSVATSAASSVASNVSSVISSILSSVTPTATAITKTGKHHHYSATGGEAIATSIPKPKATGKGKTCTRKTGTGPQKPTFVDQPKPMATPTPAAKHVRAHHAALKNRLNH